MNLCEECICTYGTYLCASVWGKAESAVLGRAIEMCVSMDGEFSGYVRKTWVLTCFRCIGKNELESIQNEENMWTYCLHYLITIHRSIKKTVNPGSAFVKEILLRNVICSVSCGWKRQNTDFEWQKLHQTEWICKSVTINFGRWAVQQEGLGSFCQYMCVCGSTLHHLLALLWRKDSYYPTYWSHWEVRNWKSSSVQVTSGLIREKKILICMGYTHNITFTWIYEHTYHIMDSVL